MRSWNLLPAGHPSPPAADPVEVIRARAELVLADAAAAGVVLTIEQRPLHPLAMGHYETVVAVRTARTPAVQMVTEPPHCVGFSKPFPGGRWTS